MENGCPRVFLGMYVRKKKNKSGKVSIQIIDKSSGQYRVAKSVGHSADQTSIEKLLQTARQEMANLTGQQQLDFSAAEDKQFVDMVMGSIDQVQLLGPELVLGKLFDQIGFGAIEDELFRYLVIARLVYPASKLKTTEYLLRYQGVHIDVDKVYRYLDKLNSKQYGQIQQISYDHTRRILNNNISIVFYDVTTLYFEAADEDDLRRTGFSKDGKHQHPQILLGLLVSVDGYPLAYEIFEGNKFEGKTMLPVIETFKEKYKLNQLIVVADAGLLSGDNISELIKSGYEFILGARIKNETQSIKDQILGLSLKDTQSTVLTKSDDTRLVVSYSDARAKKDQHNRARGLQKLERALAKGKLTKQHINNRGYNKYLQLEGHISITIDYDKYNDDAKWDGLKGYLTNTALSKESVIENYGYLWRIEKAFRISKTDLRIRPIYHRLKKRIASHICIAFSAYKVYKELERQLKIKQSEMSPEKAIDILKSIYGINLTLPNTKKKKCLLIAKQPDQVALLKLFEE